ncbi:DUF3048 domain-containing protein [Streptomyces panaciradicis]|uniref:DUF3048 domain-containing protein n=1 Tax=Streptomyces panaciradicis TaxID=1470261 RepID=UPI00201D230D|nr:DUF3048 domain-containing protein [Streptomyces panaciradicis]MCL6670958.1 DUF3048 domain-containing protein [Streptomyces panaciradicis]
MGRMVRKRRASLAVAVLAAGTAVLAAGCTSGHGPADDGRGRPKSPTASASPSTHPGSVLAVKIDNAGPARPHTGLRDADVVYVEQVEGGLSRLMAIYASKLPKAVGPVRSARESDLELLGQYHDPTLAFSGAQHKLLPLIDKAHLKAEPPEKATDAYFRGGDRPAPHNLYLRPARLMRSAPGADALTNGFRFGAAPPGGRPDTSTTVAYPSARFAFRWSADRHRWLVSMDGTPTVTTDGQPVTPATVVVQHVRIRKSGFRDFLGNNTPYTETVGSGKAEVLRDGKVYEAGWKRAKAADGTDFTTADGRPMNFASGQVWVVFVRAS